MVDHAFPVPGLVQKGYPVTGMSLRDYFAAKAMQGMLSCDKSKGMFEDFAQSAYKMADAMLEARK
jgi:hypothetical protein